MFIATTTNVTTAATLGATKESPDAYDECDHNDRTQVVDDCQRCEENHERRRNAATEKANASEGNAISVAIGTRQARAAGVLCATARKKTAEMTLPQRPPRLEVWLFARRSVHRSSPGDVIGSVASVNTTTQARPWEDLGDRASVSRDGPDDSRQTSRDLSFQTP